MRIWRMRVLNNSSTWIENHALSATPSAVPFLAVNTTSSGLGPSNAPVSNIHELIVGILGYLFPLDLITIFPRSEGFGFSILFGEFISEKSFSVGVSSLGGMGDKLLSIVSFLDEHFACNILDCNFDKGFAGFDGVPLLSFEFATICWGCWVCDWDCAAMEVESSCCFRRVADKAASFDIGLGGWLCERNSVLFEEVTLFWGIDVWGSALIEVFDESSVIGTRFLPLPLKRIEVRVDCGCCFCWRDIASFLSADRGASSNLY